MPVTLACRHGGIAHQHKDGRCAACKADYDRRHYAENHARVIKFEPDVADRTPGTGGSV